MVNTLFLSRFRSLALCLGLTLATVACNSEPEPDSSLAEKGAAAESLPLEAPRSDVILQLFNWPFARITDELPLIAEAGYAQIHVSPPQLSIATNQWWGRYQPVDYRLIAGPLGNETQFKAMIDKAHSLGVRILVDIVFNHTANPTSALPPEAAVLQERDGPLFSAEDYHDSGCINDYNNIFEVRNNRICAGPNDQGLPDLRQDSERVFREQKAFLQRLVKLGVDGFRFDAVKHIEPSYFGRLLTPEIANKKFVFGEIIFEPAFYDRDVTPYLQGTTMKLYDFAFRSTLQGAFGFGGSLKTLTRTDLVANKLALPNDRAVSFVMNHDIPNNESFRVWIMPPKDEELAYVYLLGRAEGIPYVFSDLGIESGAGLRDDRWKLAHRNPLLVKMVGFHNAMFGEGQEFAFADDCTLVMKRGKKGFFGINKCLEPRSIRVEGLTASSYREILAGGRSSVQKGSYTLELPGRSAKMYVAE